MSENERRCGLCKHWNTVDGMEPYGICLWVTDQALPIVYRRSSTTDASEGVLCSTFERKEPTA